MQAIGGSLDVSGSGERRVGFTCTATDATGTLALLCKPPLSVRSVTLLPATTCRLKLSFRPVRFPLCSRFWVRQRRVSVKRLVGLFRTSLLDRLSRSKQSLTRESYCRINNAFSHSPTITYSHDAATLSPLSSTSSLTPTFELKKKPAGLYPTPPLADYKNPLKFVISSRKGASSQCVIYCLQWIIKSFKLHLMDWRIF